MTERWYSGRSAGDDPIMTKPRLEINVKRGPDDPMTDAHSQADDSIDVRMLARQDLPHEAFPGGRNEGFRVYFTPEVHAALWKHAGEDTSVEICGVLVGSWHRDEVGPFVKVVESIRGEGAKTRFAEVTFTHQTWAKINAEMDTKFTTLTIVGWYHTHPDFGIFLSDRDRFIQEHFFSGPGSGRPRDRPDSARSRGSSSGETASRAWPSHFWVGDRVVIGRCGATWLGSRPRRTGVDEQARRAPARPTCAASP